MNEERLRKRGWSENEIKYAKNVLSKAERDYHFTKMIFWAVVLVVIIGNVVVATMLVPLLIVINNIFLDVLVAIMGFVMGYIYSFLLRDIGELEKHHHIAAGLIILGTIIVNVAAIVTIANMFALEFNLENVRQSPWIISLIYASAFALPYLFMQFKK